MFISHRWSKSTALLVALFMSSTAVSPLLFASGATAEGKDYVVGQLISQLRRGTVPASTVIPVRFDEAERIVVTPDETAPVTLTVAQDIRSTSGVTLIPAGSQIEGELQPVGSGTQFVARELILSNRRLPINATSRVITETQMINRRTNPDILKGAAIGAAAAAVISEIFGSISLGEVLGGAGIGAIASLILRGNEEVEVVIVEPDTDLDLTLQSDLVGL